MSLRSQALLEFGLPAAPPRVEEIRCRAPSAHAFRIHAPPAGRFFLLCSESALAVAFEATLFDLLAEGRYPAPRPRRTSEGSMIARLTCPSGGTAAAECYAWPPGEEIATDRASIPQLLEIGRLLARLHQLAETHPAAVADPCEGRALLAGVPAQAPLRDEIAAVLEAGLPPLPSGAIHGGLLPQLVLFSGDRCSAVLPSGAACSGPLVLDLMETALAWMVRSLRPAPALRAVVSGYQALRPLLPEERAAMGAALRFAAARTSARLAAQGDPAAIDAMRMVGEMGDAEVAAAAG